VIALPVWFLLHAELHENAYGNEADAILAFVASKATVKNIPIPQSTINRLMTRLSHGIRTRN
jgi:hypothetical protein